MVNKKAFSPKLLANRIKLLNSFFNKRTHVNGFPIELAVETTNRCNADCLMCPRSKMKRPIGDMDFKLFKKLIAEAKEYTELVWLHLAGEPLLHPGLFEMIAYAKSTGINLGFSTNAISLDEIRARKIIDSGLDLLIISFDGATKETYEKIRRLSNFQQTLDNVLNYLKLKEKSAKFPYTQIQCVYMKENQDEVEKFNKMWQQTSVDSVRFKPYFRFPSIKEDLTASQPAAAKPDKPCFLLWRQCSIYWDGTVVSCCWDHLGQTPLGNLNNQSLAEIWNGPQMQSLRKKHLQGRYKDIGLCKTCNMPQIKLPFLLGGALVDDLTIKKSLIPFFDNLSNRRKIKGAQYYS
ncbi:radical SAM/SPASM domain-containing protein [Candidatus Omnitrophota bacterium]